MGTLCHWNMSSNSVYSSMLYSSCSKLNAISQSWPTAHMENTLDSALVTPRMKHKTKYIDQDRWGGEETGWRSN